MNIVITNTSEKNIDNWINYIIENTYNKNIKWKINLFKNSSCLESEIVKINICNEVYNFKFSLRLHIKCIVIQSDVFKFGLIAPKIIKYDKKNKIKMFIFFNNILNNNIT